MRKSLLVVAALLLAGMCSVAEAANTPEQKSKNARKTLIMLNSLGLNQPELVEFIGYVDAHIDNGKLRIMEERRMDGMLKLRYRLSGGVGAKQMELSFTPDDSHMQYTASTRAVMVTYKLRF